MANILKDFCVNKYPFLRDEPDIKNVMVIVKKTIMLFWFDKEPDMGLDQILSLSEDVVRLITATA